MISFDLVQQAILKRLRLENDWGRWKTPGALITLYMAGFRAAESIIIPSCGEIYKRGCQEYVKNIQELAGRRGHRNQAL
jgi:hypothetical protein